MRETRGIRLAGSVDAEYRPTGSDCGVEFIRLLGQKEDSVSFQPDCRGNGFVGGAFGLGPSGVEVEPAADQRRQLAAASIREPILLITNRIRREYV
jgi:hypothetical protein